MKLGTSGGIKSCLLVLLGVFLLVVVGAFILSRTPPLVEFLSKSKQCFGTSVYLDGHFSFKVEHEYESLVLRRGWHVITAEKKGYDKATLGTWVESDEQTESMLIKLYCYGKSGSGKLKLFMYGQQPRPQTPSKGKKLIPLTPI